MDVVERKNWISFFSVPYFRVLPTSWLSSPTPRSRNKKRDTIPEQGTATTRGSGNKNTNKKSISDKKKLSSSSQLVTDASPPEDKERFTHQSPIYPPMQLNKHKTLIAEFITVATGSAPGGTYTITSCAALFYLFWCFLFPVKEKYAQRHFKPYSEWVDANSRLNQQ